MKPIQVPKNITALSTIVVCFLCCAMSACVGDDSPVSEWEARELKPYPNPFGPADPLWAVQPRREKPLEIVILPKGNKAYVSLQGIPDDPTRHVAVIDVTKRKLLTRIEVGSSPTGLAVHPSGKWVVVCNRFSNFVSVIDTEKDEVSQHIPADYYMTEAVFSPAGDALYLTNRWRDSVIRWDVSTKGSKLKVEARHEPGIPVGTNPRDLAISADGKTLAVGALTGMTVSLVDTAAWAEKHRILVGAPVNGLVFYGDHLVVTTLSASTHHLPFAGPDTDGDGKPGDGTPNVNFQDLQNEIAVYDRESGAERIRYTSDTICCKDYRDVDPTNIALHGDLLPPKEQWIVGGSLPEQVTVGEVGGETVVYVTYSGSDELQRFILDKTTGKLTTGPVVQTEGHNPHGVAVSGSVVLVAHRLSETVGFYDPNDLSLLGTVVVGDVSGGPFPSTDAEIGELVNFVTAKFTVDGDQSCTHCHREGGNIDKALSMPLTRYPGVGLRMTMAYRGAADTRPWFFESAMDQDNFRPVINEFARIENFCCSDYTLWPNGAPPDCAQNPPPECTTALNPTSADGFGAVRNPATPMPAHPRPTPFVTRDAFFADAAQKVVGRTMSFGDGLFFEDPITGEKKPVPLDFDGITRSLGLFLLTNTALLPNPNDAEHSTAKRGRAIFESPQTGCSACHPGPAFTVSTLVNPLNLPLTMGPVVTPLRDENGTNLDLFSKGFMDTFPLVEMETCELVCGEPLCAENANVCDDIRNISLGIPTLRGIWDRADSMLHHGNAKGLREVLATPGHPVLLPGERGFNERDGIVDTHGGTSHLTAQEIQDLISYLLTL